MPLESVIVVAAVLSMFGVFAGALAYAMVRSGSARRQSVTP